MKIIARVFTDFPSKFGIPRQSGLAEIPATVVFEPEYRVREALRGLEGFSHLWLIWKFSETEREGWSPTIRPPRLGGNTRMGVFATRSPFRPNPIGLSSVKLLRVETDTPQGPVLHISGADMMNGTPVYDIKPYLAYTDSHPDATAGFTAQPKRTLAVEIPSEFAEKMPPDKRETLLSALAQDPRPAYQNDPSRVYGFPFAGYEIRFRVEGNTLSVTSVTEKENPPVR